MNELDRLTTEARNPHSQQLDTMSAREIVDLINREDQQVALAVQQVAGTVARAIDIIADRLRRGGRLVYIGAGTSGRLGVLDAAECPPTFSTDPRQVVGLIAGGDVALRTAVEGAEDHPEFAVKDLQAIDFSPDDVLVGIACSGRTPYVLGGLQFARDSGAAAIGFSCNEGSAMEDVADFVICPVVGPEVVTGSTRMKSGTATKLVLNMLTTGAMVLLGKTYGNLMVDLSATNSKLRDRAARLVSHFTDAPRDEAESILVACGGKLKPAIVAKQRNVSPEQAEQLLLDNNGQLRAALTQPTADQH